MYRIGFKGYQGERQHCMSLYDSVAKAEAGIAKIVAMLPRSMKDAIDLRVEEVVEVSN